MVLYWRIIHDPRIDPFINFIIKHPLMQEGLRLDDLNHIIKLFSYCIQDRIDQLDSSKTTAAYRRSVIDDNQCQILERYQGYRIENLKEIKYAQKFCQRILEIFSYFKGRSRHPNLLVPFEEKIIGEMDLILTRHPIALDGLLGFVVGFVKRPFKGRRDLGFPVKQVTTRNPNPNNNNPASTHHPKTLSQTKPKPLKSSSSQLNIVRTQLRKSALARKDKQNKFQPSQSEMSRLYCSLNLDRYYLQRCSQQIVLLQKEAAERMCRDMMRRNERIQVEMMLNAKRWSQRQEIIGSLREKAGNYSEELNSRSELPGGDAKILRQAKKNINLLQTPTKQLTGTTPNSTIKQKNLNPRRPNPDTLYNNWLPRRDSKQQNLSQIDSNYNFCLKEVNKLQQHRKLRRVYQENQGNEQFSQNRSVNETMERGLTKHQVDDLVRLLI